MDVLPVWLLFLLTVLLIAVATEAGYWLGGMARKRSEDEKEAPVSAISGAILALTAFILAFAFSMVSNRYDTRKELVRNEANAIGTAYLRTDFLPEEESAEAKQLLRRYTTTRIAAAQSGDMEQVRASMLEATQIQTELWNMAVANARLDMNSDVAALYIESLNEVIDIHGLRVAIALQSRVPLAIWLMLYALLMLGMFAIGYQTAIAGSRRSWALLILIVSFAMVMALIALLDRPNSGALAVSQQPLINLQQQIGE
jgi:hypothetical protein